MEETGGAAVNDEAVRSLGLNMSDDARAKAFTEQAKEALDRVDPTPHTVPRFEEAP